MIPGRYAARNLKIDQPVLHPVSAHDLSQDKSQGGKAHRLSYPQFSQRPLQPFKMKPLIHEPACPDPAHFIDAVGELISPVLNVNCRLGMADVTSVNIGDAGQGATLRIRRIPG